jgi:hypothetical protein
MRVQRERKRAQEEQRGPLQQPAPLVRLWRQAVRGAGQCVRECTRAQALGVRAGATVRVCARL